MINDVQWLRLDNSGKLFPMLKYKDNQNIFRISVQLNELINPEILEESVNTTLNRFPSFKVSLRRGVFWYYFENNPRRYNIVKEDDIIMRSMNMSSNNGFPFRISYHENRMNFEIYHCVADGSGLLEFIKSLLIIYLAALGHNIDTDGIVKMIDEPVDSKEYEDSFITNYKKMRIRDMSISKMTGMTSVYRVGGETFNDDGKGVVTGTCPTKDVITLAKSNGCTVTEYLCGLYMYSIYMAKGRHETNPANLVVFIPMNLRKIYNSVTLRNFSLFSRATMPLNRQDITLKEFINSVKIVLKEELEVSEINKNISTAVRAEKLIAMRVLPLFAKKMIFKITNFSNGIKPTKTSTFSNIGYINLPDGLREHISGINFNIRTSKSIPISMSMLSAFDKMSMSITRTIVDTDIEQFYFSYLANNGVNLTMTSNYWEVDHVL